MDPVLVLVIFTVIVALSFDVINGFHDAANSIATVVSTRVLSPRLAVIWAAFFNFIAMFFFAPKVADTISKIIHINPQDPACVYVVLSGLIGAIFWDLLTWWWRLPTSSSHALIGGFAGAGITYAGFAAPRWDKLLKTIGIIVALLVASGHMQSNISISLTDFSTSWIILSCHLAMGIGTAFGGWRIVKTMGMKITKLKPVGGFCAETAGAVTLFFATHAGIPVSTTHTIAGSIIGGDHEALRNKMGNRGPHRLGMDYYNTGIRTCGSLMHVRH
jgi:PiT family inorganic phosphate transporter